VSADTNTVNATGPGTAAQDCVVSFGGLTLGYGPDVIVPRPWTLAQSQWAAELAADVPAGPIVELCAGCGAIGLEAARLSERPVVLVDASAEACRWAFRNALANGLGRQIEVRNEPLDVALRPGERVGLILADPPYVPTAEIDRFPEDPRSAIDGGADGLDLLRAVVRVVHAHLLPGGVALIQVRGADQAGEVERLASGAGHRPDERSDDAPGEGGRGPVLRQGPRGDRAAVVVVAVGHPDVARSAVAQPAGGRARQLQRASWKMTPSASRRPESTVLTPWRIATRLGPLAPGTGR
jgi:methylase of polypeptide subunit release factors